MFDFRYHVASLAAVFLALVVGILVGVGIAGRSVVNEADRKIYQNEIQQLQADVDASNARIRQLQRQQAGSETLVEEAYPALMVGRLAGKHVAVLVVGRDDGAIGSSVERALADAGAAGTVRYRALKVPLDVVSVRKALAGKKQLAAYSGERKVAQLGAELGRELVRGGKTPLWEALSSLIVEERRDAGRDPADGVVVIRTVEPQSGDTARFLSALYASLAASGVPAIGVERSDANPSALPAFTRADLSTVNDIEAPLGRLALVLLLSGAEPGRYGLGDKAAPDGLLPTITPLPPATTTTTGA